MLKKVGHHGSVLQEYGQKSESKDLDNKALFFAAGIQIVEKNGKKYIKLDTSIFGLEFPSKFRKILESPNLRDISELKNRYADFGKTESNSMEGVPVRVAFSTYPLFYKGGDDVIISLIQSGEIKQSDILEHKNNFYLDLAINNNPNGMSGSLTPLEGKIVNNPINTYQELTNEKIGQVLEGIQHSVVKNDDSLGLIVSDGTNEQIINGYTCTYDKLVSGLEMGKTTVRSSGDVILDQYDDPNKLDRFNSSVNLGTLIDYFNDFYTTSNNSNGSIIESSGSSLKLISNDLQLIIGELSFGKGGISNLKNAKDTVYPVKKIDKLKHTKYMNFINKLTFDSSGIISMKAKDLELTPPLILWIENLIREGSHNDNDVGSVLGNTMVFKKTEEEKIGRKFEDVMKEILNLEGEDKIQYSEKKINGRFGTAKNKTPDYIELLNENDIKIYDFKTGTTHSEYTKFEDSNQYRVKYEEKTKNNVDTQIITLVKEKSFNNDKIIYYEDFFSEKGITLTEKQSNSLKQLERCYHYQNSVANTQEDTKGYTRVIIT